jgi:hypothetical protein
MIEASQQRSYCWFAPQTWTDSRGHQGPGAPPGYSNHQYELTDPVNSSHSLELEAPVSTVMHRNPSILQTAMNFSTSTSSRGLSTPRALASQNSIRGPSLSPVRGPLASPSLMGSPLGSALTSPDAKADYDLMMRAPPLLAPPARNPRRVSPAPVNRVSSPMSPLVLDGISHEPPMLHSSEIRIDDGPPQLGELPFARKDD